FAIGHLLHDSLGHHSARSDGDATDAIFVHHAAGPHGDLSRNDLVNKATGPHGNLIDDFFAHHATGAVGDASHNFFRHAPAHLHPAILPDDFGLHRRARHLAFDNLRAIDGTIADSRRTLHPARPAAAAAIRNALRNHRSGNRVGLHRPAATVLLNCAVR